MGRESEYSETPKCWLLMKDLDSTVMVTTANSVNGTIQFIDSFGSCIFQRQWCLVGLGEYMLSKHNMDPCSFSVVRTSQLSPFY